MEVEFSRGDSGMVENWDTLYFVPVRSQQMDELSAAIYFKLLKTIPHQATGGPSLFSCRSESSKYKLGRFLFFV